MERRLLLAGALPLFVLPMHHPRRARPTALFFLDRQQRGTADFFFSAASTPVVPGGTNERTGMVSVQCRRFCPPRGVFQPQVLAYRGGVRACLLFPSRPRTTEVVCRFDTTWVPRFAFGCPFKGVSMCRGFGR
jgi:hypothetical protein